MLKTSFSKYQKTFKNAIPCIGVGLHSGVKTTMTFHPAPTDTGIVFRRVDVLDKNNLVPATFENVKDTRLCSALENEEGVRVSTIEHVMAALHAMGISNALIDVDAPEVPIMDGSAEDFIFLFERAGIVEQEALQYAWKIKKDVVYKEGDIEVSLSPSCHENLNMEFEIDFKSKIIGKQKMTFELTAESFKKELAYARTFCSLSDIEQLRKMGLAKGGSLENALVVDGDTLLNKDGLRDKKEFVRHKILDAVGDLYQAGLPLIGTFKGRFSGHAFNNKLLRKLFADKEAFEKVYFFEEEVCQKAS
ncbi:MAG: UDP-3-O-[3-hydroxymyristoyl] N-acetylglucosamine deacetylase [Alphaproteobacteria bacterium]|nr:UDP-3-O-acyl-N-acetylglucosamine deacetylase [Alphaproteobacteria bacterium]NCB49647.1 UDP-3-O-[3-hydroxymyristoyl] N-acetylglucosamine deacetylase [Alphaproteobacteria bacterium]